MATMRSSLSMASTYPAASVREPILMGSVGESARRSSNHNKPDGSWNIRSLQYDKASSRLLSSCNMRQCLLFQRPISVVNMPKRFRQMTSTNSVCCQEHRVTMTLRRGTSGGPPVPSGTPIVGLRPAARHGQGLLRDGHRRLLLLLQELLNGQLRTSEGKPRRHTASAKPAPTQTCPLGRNSSCSLSDRSSSIRKGSRRIQSTA